jgi:hypothetical protein
MEPADGGYPDPSEQYESGRRIKLPASRNEAYDRAGTDEGRKYPERTSTPEGKAVPGQIGLGERSFE